MALYLNYNILRCFKLHEVQLKGCIETDFTLIFIIAIFLEYLFLSPLLFIFDLFI